MNGIEMPGGKLRAPEVFGALYKKDDIADLTSFENVRIWKEYTRAGDLESPLQG